MKEYVNSIEDKSELDSDEAIEYFEKMYCREMKGRYSYRSRNPGNTLQHATEPLLLWTEWITYLLPYQGFIPNLTCRIVCLPT